MPLRDHQSPITSSNEDSIRTETLFVLYGSQTGNSEQAAEQFCCQLKEKFTLSYFCQQKLPPVKVKPICMQLDDFLDYWHASFSRTLVIFVSSYGVGQAPMGSYKFRSLADELLLLVNRNREKYRTLLRGLRYAICGLGDSSYSTYLVNPTTIDKSLTSVGATRIGEMGKADAKQIGEKAQDKIIDEWKENLWMPLAHALAVPTGEVDEKKIQDSVIPILMKLDSDYVPPKKFLKKHSTWGIPITLFALSVIVGVVTVLFFRVSSMKNP